MSYVLIYLHLSTYTYKVKFDPSEFIDGLNRPKRVHMNQWEQ